MLLIFQLFFVLIFWNNSGEGLEKININLKPYLYRYVDESFSENFATKPINLVQKNIADTAEVRALNSYPPFKTKKRKMRMKKKKTIRSKSKPKKMNLRRIFKTRLITTTTTTQKPFIINENSINEEDKTRGNVISLAPINDHDTGINYTKDELNGICLETVQMSRNFGIEDIEIFAKNNCFLIRLYYSNVTCSQINQLIDYCVSNGLING